HRGSKVLHEAVYLLAHLGARRADRSDCRIPRQREQRAQRSSRVWAGAHPSGRNARVHRGGAAAAAAAHAVVVRSVPALAGPVPKSALEADTASLKTALCWAFEAPGMTLT